MTPLEAILKIKGMFAEVNPAAPVEAAAPEAVPAAEPTEAAKEYVLVDGTKVMVDKLEIGGSVSMVDANGNASPAPAGEYALADGMTLTVDDMGMIAEVSSAAEETVDAQEPNAEMVAALAKITELESQLNSMKDLMAQYQVESKSAESKFSKAISDLSDVVVGLIGTPSAAPTEPAKNTFSKINNDKDDKIKRFLDLAKSINK